MMFSAAVAMYKAALFRHWPSLTVMSTFLAKGLQDASSDMTMPTHDPTTMNIVKKTLMRKPVAGFMFRYKQRNDSLAKARAGEYSTVVVNVICNGGI